MAQQKGRSLIIKQIHASGNSKTVSGFRARTFRLNNQIIDVSLADPDDLAGVVHEQLVYGRHSLEFSGSGLLDGRYAMDLANMAENPTFADGTDPPANWTAWPTPWDVVANDAVGVPAGAPTDFVAHSPTDASTQITEHQNTNETAAPDDIFLIGIDAAGSASVPTNFSVRANWTLSDASSPSDTVVVPVGTGWATTFAKFTAPALTTGVQGQVRLAASSPGDVYWTNFVFMRANVLTDVLRQQIDGAQSYFIVVPGVGTFNCPIKVESLEFTGEVDGNLAFSATFRSSGEYVFTAA